MPTTDRIPVLVYDDGTPGGILATQRALTMAMRIVLVNAHGTPNHTANVAAADQAGVKVEVINLDAHQGIRHALALCAERDIYLACIPHPGSHTGQQLRKIIQAAATSETSGLPVLAVRIVHPDAPTTGPIVEIDPAHADVGFVSLLAAGLAATTTSPLHIVRLAGNRTEVNLRAAEALQQARALIADNGLPVYDEATNDDPIATALRAAKGASAIIIGIGNMNIEGRKLTAPDELPDNVLRSSDSQLAHQLARHAETDVIVVLDTIELHHGKLATITATTAAITAITAGTLLAGTAGLAFAGGAVTIAVASYTRSNTKKNSHT